MPLVYMQDEARGRENGVQPVLVFTEGGKPIGLAIDEIVDIVEEHLDIELKTEAPGVIGAAIVKGKAVEIVDVSHYLGRQASATGSHPSPTRGAGDQTPAGR